MLDRTKYRRIPDLYVVGTELVLQDGTVMWLQILNPFERDEARHDAATARSRLVLALHEHGSDELTQVRSQFVEDGREAAIARIIEARSNEVYLKAATALRAEEGWREKLDILDRSDVLLARPPEDAERALLISISETYHNEITSRLEAEAAYQREHFEHISEAELWEEYLELYLSGRGTEVALAEYRLTEMWYAARCCDGVMLPDGTWGHGMCDGHQVRVYADKTEVRSLPEALQQLTMSALVSLEMTEVEAKNSARQGSSSASSPLPNVEAASTASTQTATPEQPPGTSTPPSLTPSPS